MTSHWTPEEILEELHNRFASDLLLVEPKSAKRLYIDIKPEAVVRVGTYLFRELGARYNIASGLETPEHLEVIHHFTVEDCNLLVSVRVRLDRARPELDTLANAVPAANWIEREIQELLGVTFLGHPDPRRLLLPEQWPEGVFPLRQDYQEWDSAAVRTRGV